MPDLPDHPFAEGRTASLYAWKEGWALKLYNEFDWLTEAYPRLEANMTRAVGDAGIPAPRVGEVLRVNGRWALELEHLEGETLGDQLASKLWLARRTGRQLADMHIAMHQVTLDSDLPRQRKRLRDKINSATGLTSETHRALEDALESLPEGQQICHGDFHPWNIIVTPTGPVTIDWVDCTVGNPYGDVARTLMLVRSMSHMDELQLTREQRLAIEIVANTYRRRYFRWMPGSRDDFNGWMAVVCAARLVEGIPGQRTWLLSELDRYLSAWTASR